MPKRSHDTDVEELVESINLDKGLIDGLLQLKPDELASLLGEVANKANLPTTTIKKFRADLPSFSVAKWTDFASQFGLNQDASLLKLDTFKTPRYYLPPSLHVIMFENAWQWQDVYCEKYDQTREQARIRILDPVCQSSSRYIYTLYSDRIMQYIVPIVALFHGRVVNKPEEVMPKTKYSTGGQVEHEVSP